MADTLPPTPDQVRARSELLTGKYPAPLPPAADPLVTSGVLGDAVAQVGSLTGRIMDPSHPEDAASTYDDTPEPVPPGLVPTALRATTLMAEAIAVTREPKRAKQRAGRLRLRGFTAGPYCVPMDSEALTPRGWRSYGDLCVGDDVLGFDFAEGAARWTPIEEIIAPFEADLVRVGNRYWSALCTREHRWVVRRRHDRGGKASRERYVAGDWQLGTLDDMVGATTWFDVLTSAPAATEHRLPITAAEAALVAWLWTDGHVARRDQAPPEVVGRALSRRAHISGTIYQKRHRDEVEAVLAATGAPVTVVEADTARYRVRSPWLRDLWDRAQLWALTPVEFVLRLGPDEREAFLAAGVWAEGTRPRYLDGRRAQVAAGRWYRWQFAQNRGPVLDAFALAAHLSGYTARPWRGRVRPRLSGFAFGRPFHSGQRMRVADAGRGLVWCVRTGLGTWTMRQGDVISLTGNSEQYWDPAMVRGGTRGRPSFVDDPDLDDALWALATEDARFMLIYEAGGQPPPGAAVSAFNFNRRAGVGLEHGVGPGGVLGISGDGLGSGPDGF